MYQNYSYLPNIKEGASAPSFIFLLSRCRTRTHSSGTVRWTVPVTSSKTGGYNNFLPLGKNANRVLSSAPAETAPA